MRLVSKTIFGLLFLVLTGINAQEWSTPDNFVTFQINQVTPMNREMAYNYDLKPIFSLAGTPFAAGVTLSKLPSENRITEFQLSQSTWTMGPRQPVQFTQNAIFMRLKEAFPLEKYRLIPYAGFGIGVNLADFTYSYVALVDSNQEPVNYTSTATYLAIGGQAMAGVLWFPTRRFGVALEACYQLDYFDNRNNGNLGFQGWLQVLPSLVVAF